MLKILQARLQQYMNCELPDVQVGFKKDRGNRDQIVKIHWIIEKTREFQKNIWFCLQKTGSKSGKEYVKAVYCHPAYLTYMQSTS